MPQYKKVFDVGTYAGVSEFTRVGIPTLRTPGSGGKQVAKSLRFRSANSAYLSRTPASAGNQTTWTLSFWLKRGSVNTGSAQWLFSGGSGTFTIIGFNANDTMFFGQDTTGYGAQTSAVYRDPSAWMHVVCVANTSDATQSNRLKIFVNGSLASAITGTVAQNYATYWNTATAQAIGRYNASAYFDGYLAEVNFIDGQALTPSSFGEYNSDNIWVPKAYSGSYGTNGFYLDFNDTSSVAALGYDAAGSNDWTVNGISLTAGTTYDSMYDSPTDYDNSVYGAGTYPVLNPLDKGSVVTINNGNLGGTQTSLTAQSCRATMSIPTSGLWYWEFTNLGGNNSPGVQNTNASISSYCGFDTNGWSYFIDGQKYNNNIGVAYGSTHTTNDVIGIAYDATNNALYFGKQTGGTGSMVWQNSGDPTSGASKTGAAFTNITGPLFPAISTSVGVTVNFAINFGQRPFSATPPTGFKALNTKNITRPTDANMWFYGDTPDLMWIKNRSATADHSLTDTVRGVGLGLSSSSTAVEQGAQDVAEMNKFGMTLIGASSRTTAASNNFVYWGWKGGGAAVTNTSGSITSTVSANTSAGFSVVTWTGNGGTNQSIGHGLSATPNMIIVKNRDDTAGWRVWQQYMNASPNSGRLDLNTTNAFTTNANEWGSTFTSTLFYVNVNNCVNTNKYVAYCFAPVAGYSAFGSYTGNGSTTGDGPFIYTGFRVKWLMVKRYDTGSTSNWQITHTGGSYYNGSGQGVYANLTQAEGTGVYHDLLSNGFKVKTNDGDANTLNGTYIYAAFAEHPFKIARAR